MGWRFDKSLESIQNTTTFLNALMIFKSHRISKLCTICQIHRLTEKLGDFVMILKNKSLSNFGISKISWSCFTKPAEPATPQNRLFENKNITLKFIEPGTKNLDAEILPSVQGQGMHRQKELSYRGEKHTDEKGNIDDFTWWWRWGQWHSQ